MNDNSPAFSQASYVQNIDEGDVGPDGKYVLTISAVDNDGTSPNNDVVYSITIGLSSVFSINSTTVSLSDTIKFCSETFDILKLS